MNPQLSLGSLFDGIGGFPYAASFYGIRSLWASEIIPECISVTKRHFPDMEHLGDITKLNGSTMPPVDIITFGSPCQDLSVASGKRLGLAGERSGLFLEAIRIIREMREATNGEYPQFAVWENVPGALSSSARRDFKAVLEAFTEAEVPMPGSRQWANAGMVRSRNIDLAWCVYNAQHFGTAQRRRRVFLVADFRGNCAGEILFVPKSLRRYFEAGGTPRQGAAAYAETGVGEADTIILNDQGGNSMNVEKEDISPTLRSQTHGNLPVVAAYGLQGSIIGRKDTNGPNGGGVSQDVSFTLNTIDHHAVCTARTHPKIAGTLCASGAGLSRPAGQENELDFCVARLETGREMNSSDMELCVRRLTPIEAERLQGYPDGWTEYGADQVQLSDTKRYQMLGNSIAVPCVAYIMQGICDIMNKKNMEENSL